MAQLLSKLHIKGPGTPRSVSDSDSNISELERSEKGLQSKDEKHLEKELKKFQKEEEARKRREEEERLAAQEDPPEMRARYGFLSINPLENPKQALSNLASLTSNHSYGEEVVFDARLHNVRNISAALAFVVLRKQEHTIQGVLEVEEGLVSTHFVRWVEHLSQESIVRVRGILKEPLQKVIGASVHDSEVKIRELHVISRLTDKPPFSVYGTDVASGDRKKDHLGIHEVPPRTRIANRVIDLRTPTSQVLFRINAAICSTFRSTLEAQNFIEIHTTKLQGGATESGSSVFPVEYFGRTAFLAQSPQLSKQMCISADFERVYEIGPVFRAENSNTHRHLTEYTGLDLEMAIVEDYHEMMRVVDNMLKNIFKAIYDRFRGELELIKRHFPHEDLVWLDETPVIPFKDAVNMLREAGWTDDEGKPPSEYEDLSTPAETKLGALMKEKHHTDYYIVDKFPASARPFYTMLDAQDPAFTNSFDVFLRGQEITTGGQRIHDAEMLEERMARMHISPEGMEAYMDGFHWGAPPHGGAGIGLERLIMLFLGLPDIRLASLFPRDPQSLKSNGPVNLLRHPEASTLHPQVKCIHGKKEVEYPPLVKLIANYGTSTSTSLLEDKVHIWRYKENGAVVGWVPSGKGYAIILGDPLCERSQFPRVTSAFLRYLNDEVDLKPIWILIGAEMEEVLGGRLDWNTLSCIGEERMELKNNSYLRNKALQHKTRQASNADIKISSFAMGKAIPEDFQARADARFADWLANRKGKQVHLSVITRQKVFQDFEHRWYFFAEDRSHTLCGLLVLTQLAAERQGWQVKYQLDFPGAPSGAIEALTLHAFQEARGAGIQRLTFGAGASKGLTTGHGVTGLQAKILDHTYGMLSKNLGLGRKTAFREKLGTEQEALFIAYPKHGLGLTGGGVRAIMDFFHDDG